MMIDLSELALNAASARQMGRVLIQINGPGRPSNHNRDGVAPAMADAYTAAHLDLYMTDHANNIEQMRKPVRTLREELFVFLIIVALVWPVVTVGVVGGYGFTVWMYQLIAGPPGPPKR
jgi:nitrate reductase NapE